MTKKFQTQHKQFCFVELKILIFHSKEATSSQSLHLLHLKILKKLRNLSSIIAKRNFKPYISKTNRFSLFDSKLNDIIQEYIIAFWDLVFHVRSFMLLFFRPIVCQKNHICIVCRDWCHASCTNLRINRKIQ